VLYVLGPAEKKLSEVYKNSLYFENILEMAKTLLTASLYIGLDSGVSQLSSYLGIPSVIIFGPTDSKVWHPIGRKNWIIRYKNCLPCFPHVCEDKKCLNTDFLKTKIEDFLNKNIK
jgi:ADP-heptose:LPS heptosyltransferase